MTYKTIPQEIQNQEYELFEEYIRSPKLLQMQTISGNAGFHYLILVFRINEIFDRSDLIKIALHNWFSRLMSTDSDISFCFLIPSSMHDDHRLKQLKNTYNELRKDEQCT
jgi:hypothetical protein